MYPRAITNQQAQLLMDDIFERFKTVIRQNTAENRRWVELAELTDIPATSWNKAVNG